MSPLAPRPSLATRVGLVLRRELCAAFDSSIAYVYTIAALLLANAVFMNEFFLSGNLDMGPFFTRTPYLLAFLLPAISMGQWAEERRRRTLEVLLTLPVGTGAAVLGKFLAGLGLALVFLAGTSPIVGMLLALGEPDLGRIACGYLGMALLCAVLLAFGGLLSALVADQIVAFVTASVGAVLLVLIGHPRVVEVVDGLWPPVAPGTWLARSLSVLPPYESFVQGVVSLHGVVFFAGFTAVFLWLTRVVLDGRRP